MRKLLCVAAAMLAVSAPAAYAIDDDMMGTFINGRMETRGERGVRVQDPAMDHEDMVRDRIERQQRASVRKPDGRTPAIDAAKKDRDFLINPGH